MRWQHEYLPNVKFCQVLSGYCVAEIRRNIAKDMKVIASVGRPKVVNLLASGGFAPDPLTRGSAPGPRWGLCSQTPS